MAVELPPVSRGPARPTPGATLTPALELTPSFDVRWAAWEAKGAAHDRAVRRKAAIAAPILVMVGAVLLYLLLRS